LAEPLPLLTIAGSDSGGAAGLQADLKTWTALGCYGMSAITAVTAQNSARVAAVHYLPPEMVAAQIDAVLSDYGAAAIKTGFLGRVDIIEVVAERLAYWLPRCEALRKVPRICHCVIDPVLVNHRGEAMFGPEVAAAYRELLFPLADLVTPNRAEAALFGMPTDGRPPTAARGRATTDDGRQTTERIAATGTRRVLIKGLAREEEMVDIYWDGSNTIELSQPRIDTANTHGSGDTLSAAVCAFRALGYDWLDAIRRAQAYTHEAIRRGARWRLGAGHGPLGH
jgi:hydroxymethylpyrimidine/phosphomethylpyrimidine kinase